MKMKIKNICLIGVAICLIGIAGINILEEKGVFK